MEKKQNALIYTKDKLMNGAYLFKTYIDESYELKQQKVKGSKDLLNILWGALVESEYYNHFIEQEEKCKVDDARITRIIVDNKIRIKCIYRKKNNLKRRGLGSNRLYWLMQDQECFSHLESLNLS